MPERIDTKAVLADCLPPNPANYKSDFLCMTKALLQLETVRAALAQEIADRKALEKALPAKDAEGLARVCMSFAADMLHKQDNIGQRFWTEQAKRLRAYATLRGEEKQT